MTIYRFGSLACVCVALLSGGMASAQDAVGQETAAKATNAEGIGQGIGEAASGGQSVFVTATGREVLSAPVDTYVTNVEGRAASAVDAAKMRDDRLATAQALAQKFGVTVYPGVENFGRDFDASAQLLRIQQAQDQAVRAARKGTKVVITGTRQEGCVMDCVFWARTSVQFKASDPAQVPAFLDALAAAGILVDKTNIVSLSPGLDTVDDAVWDHASQKAVALALHQAQVLAKAAGREVGDAEQIMVLSKSLQGNVAILTLSVRYLLR